MLSILTFNFIGLFQAKLEGDVDALQRWLAFWTCVVVVGLLLEYGGDIAKISCERLERARAHNARISDSSLHKTFRWISLFVASGAVLVTVGVAGELYVEVVVSRAETSLRNLTDSINAQSRKDISEANARASAAEATARGFQAQIANANVRIRDAEAEVARAMAATAKAEAGAEEARAMAQSAELARVQLEERIAPRTLNTEQRASIGKALSPFARQFFGRHVKLDWSVSDPESTIFAIELEDSLKRAGIEVDRPTATILGGGIKIGFAIVGAARDGAFIRQLYTVLHVDFPRESMLWEAALKNEGLPVTITIGVKTPLGIETLPVAPTPPIAVPTPTLDRHLTPDQKSVLARQLFPFRGARFILLVVPMDREAAVIATDIDAALGPARWIGVVGRPPPIINRVHGIVIEVNRSATDRDRNAADWLAMALGDAHLNVVGPVPSNENSIAPITIMIGSNP